MSQGMQDGVAIGFGIVLLVWGIVFLTSPKLKHVELPDGTTREGPGPWGAIIALAVLLAFLLAAIQATP